MSGLASSTSILGRAACLLALALAGHPALAQVKVSPDNAYVLQGTSQAFTAVGPDPHATWVWSLVGGPGIGSIGTHTGLYVAPQDVAEPLPFQVRVADADHPAVTGMAQAWVTPHRINLRANLQAPVMQEMQIASIRAHRAGGEQARWAWRVDELPGATGIHDHNFYFRAPKVAGPTVFHVRASDLAHPGDSATLAVTVVPAMVSLRLANPEVLPLRSGQTCDLEASRADGMLGPWKWEVLGEGQGTLQDLGHGRARFTASRAVRPTTVHLRASSAARYEAELVLAVQPTIHLTTGSSTHVFSGRTCVVKASQPDPLPASTWEWTLLSPKGVGPCRQLPEARNDTFSFLAPEVAWPTRFTLQVQDRERPDDPATLELLVLPRLPGLRQESEAVFDQLMPRIMGSDWLAPVPAATLLAGTLGAPHPGEPRAFSDIQCITYVEEDPAMGWLSRKWLVGDQTGIKAVSAMGEATPLPGISGQVCAIAVRPRGSAPGNPNRVVFAVQQGASWSWDVQRAIFALRPDGTVTALAGTLGPVPRPAWLDTGRGPRVEFRAEIVHLAPAEDGGVLVFQDPDSSGTRVRRIAEDGQVTLVRHYSIENEARNLIWDAGRELVYLVKDNELVQVDKDGKVTALIPDPANEEDDKPEQMASLQRLGDSIFIADARGNGLWVLNLETKDVFHLVGERTQHQTRLGPLPYASPERSIHDCAALDSPEVFFVNQEGEGVVAQGDALVHLDLGAFAVAPPDDRLELEGKAPAGSAPQPASAVAAGSGPAMPSHKRKVPDSGLEEHHANPPQPPGPE